MDEATQIQSPQRFFRLLLEYDGSDFHGWQRQESSPSVQQAVEEALEAVVRHPVRTTAAGRTDAGVHAAGQVVRFVTTNQRVNLDNLVRGGNMHLPGSVRILDAQSCPESFDPRGDGRLRWYRYSLLNRGVAPALGRGRLTHWPRPLDWNRAREALRRLRGDHDFEAFRSSACQAKRTQLDLRVARHIDEHPLHHVEFVCRSFLHHMVRMMMGVVLEVAEGRCEPEVVTEMLETGHRAAGLRTAPAAGLVLMGVGYGDEACERWLAGQAPGPDGGVRATTPPPPPPE